MSVGEGLSVQMVGNGLRRRLQAALILLCLLLGLAAAAVAGMCACPVCAHADGLKVYVGYSGGPYYLKHEYTEADLWALADGTMYQYTFMDKGSNRLVKAYGVGPTLEAIFSNAYDSSTNTAVNPNQLWRFHMGTTDNYIPDDSGIENGGYGFAAWWWQDVSQGTAGALGAVRYCYPDLGGTYTYVDEAGLERTGENFNYEESTLLSDRLDAIMATGFQVPSIIALRSSWIRVTSAEQWDAETGPATADECKTASNRVLFGQSSPTEIAGVASAHSVNAILCIYDGAPTVSVTTDTGESSFCGDIGTTVTVKATVNSADALINQNAADYLDWTLTDENGDDVSEAYELTRNDDGTVSITIAGDGNVSIAVSYGNSAAEDFRATGSMSGGGPHSDYDLSQGSGQGYGDATGAGSAAGAGSDSGTDGTTGPNASSDASAAAADSAGGASSSSASAATQASYQVQKIIDENTAEQLQIDLDISEIPWGGILLVLAIVLGSAFARIGAYVWDIDRRRYLKAHEKAQAAAAAQEASAV